MTRYGQALQGKLFKNLDGITKNTKTGDFVFIEKGRKHKITACGKELSIRMAGSRYDVEHVYPDE